MVEIKEIKDYAIKQRYIKRVIDDLPEFFGIEAANQMYQTKGAKERMIAAFKEEQLQGVIVIKKHFDVSYEVYFMGIVKRAQRKGIGKQLMAYSEDLLKREGVRFLQVKTLDASHSDLGYQKTRAFYEACAFSPLEVMKELWGKENPCRIYVKGL